MPNLKRVECRLVVSNAPTDENTLRNLISKIIDEETSKDPDIDELILLLYENEEEISGFYSIAKAIWAPKGELGNVTPEIAHNNIRSNYRTSFDIRSKEGLAKPSKREFDIYYKFDKELWKDPNVDEEIIKKRVARSFGISEDELDEIYLKVAKWKLGEK